MKSQRALRAFRAACLFVFLFLSITAASSAATPRWELATPFGGPIAALAQAPSAPRTLYAASLNGRLFRSLDGGATWRLRREPTGDGVIAHVFVDFRDPQTVYALTSFPMLFRSRDGGLSWSEIGPEPQQTVVALALDPGRPSVLWAALQGGLYRSADRGGSWRRVAFAGLFVTGVAVDPRDPDTVFATTADREGFVEVWKSTDRGSAWTPASTPEASAGISHFVFDPARPEILYLFFTSEFSPPVLRSTDGGASWTLLPNAVGVRDLAVAPDGTLFAATVSGLARSTDRGETWVPALPPASAVPADSLTQVLVSPTAPGELLLAGFTGIWRSGDNGATWAGSNQGIVAQGAYSVAVAPDAPFDVFAVIWSSLARSADRGATWTRLTSPLQEPQPYVIEAFDTRRPRKIYGFDTDGQAAFPVVSPNGRRWTKLRIPYSCDNSGSVCDVSLATLALDPDDPDTIVVGGSYFFHFQGSGSFLLRSENGGQSWEELASVERINDLAIDPRRSTTYHAVSCAGLFRSANAGRTWRRTGSGLPENLCTSDRSGASVVIDPEDSRRLYVSTLSQGVFASSDGGATFRPMNRGLETAPVVTLLIDPTDSTKLYAGVALQGVFQWNANRGRWTPLNRGLPLDQFGGAIALDPRQPSILFAASPNEGVFRLDLEDGE